MSLWRHVDYTDGTRVQTMPNRPTEVRCSHGDCQNRNWRAEAAVEVVVLINPRYGSNAALTAKVIAPCMNHRRSMKQQIGRGISEYQGLRFTGIRPVVGLDWESAADAVLAQERIAIAAREAERQRIIDARRVETLQSFLTTDFNGAPRVSLRDADEYGRRHINVNMSYYNQMTPAQAEYMARQLTSFAVQARAEAQTALVDAQARELDIAS